MEDIIGNNGRFADPFIVARIRIRRLIDVCRGAVPVKEGKLLKGACLRKHDIGLFVKKFAGDEDAERRVGCFQAVILIIVDANGIPGTGRGIVEIDILRAFAILVVAIKGGKFVSEAFYTPYRFSVFEIDVRAIAQ